MSPDRAIHLLVTITLVEMMVLIGLRATFAELAETAREWRLLARAAVANYLLVPGAAIGLLLAFQATPMVAAGFLILAVCPGAPYGPPLAGVARANVAMAVGLMVVLAGSRRLFPPCSSICCCRGSPAARRRASMSWPCSGPCSASSWRPSCAGCW
ncbi:MAG TPA: bile acid:sodium symporter [Xanthobacteraceae bacterium]